MFGKLDIFQMAQSMASHAAFRQTAINQNIANADTPGYKALDTASFARTYETQTGSPMHATRSGHLGFDATVRSEMAERSDPGAGSPNGNTVSIEDEMVTGVEVKRQHDLALAIYKSSLNIMRSSLGRG